MSGGESTQIQVSRAFQRTFQDAEIIFDEGDAGIDLYVIQSGQVQISRTSSEGERIVAKLGPGEFFGEMGVLAGGKRTASVVALTEASLLELKAEDFKQLLSAHPAIEQILNEVIAERKGQLPMAGPDQQV